MQVFILASNPIEPIVQLLSRIIDVMAAHIGYGWALVAFAALVRVVFWGLNTKQFKSMIEMQAIAPKLKAVQQQYKGDHQRIQQETMALYKAHNVNPMASCLPMLVQMPILFSVFYAVRNNLSAYQNQHWLWISPAASAISPHVFGAPLFGLNLAHTDVLLLVLYVASMYFSVRYSSMPATDPQQAQTQKMMAILSPAMIAYLGFRYQWPSALILYWLSFNAFTMAQQFYLLRKYHKPLTVLDSEHVITEDVPVAPQPARVKTSTNGSSRSRRSRRRSRR
ncbi:MAG: YidC/Oxa1 family membrane protein insertase [Candidatus Eremiobacteraeota bacterium]|nr:YidC/Oxa1 family membrane protein insertase [Candidatus Eremiobacteraeota bacterium]